MSRLNVTLIAALIAADARAEEAPPEPPIERAPEPVDLSPIERRLEALEAKAHVEAPPPKPVKTGSVAIAPGKGLRIESADGRFLVTIRGRAQVRETFVSDDKGETNEINIRTARLSFAGHLLTPKLKYLLQLAFGPG